MATDRLMMVRAILGASVTMSALAGAGVAQEAAPREARLGTVTVTAQKVEEDLQDVPVSITTLGSDTLEALKASGADIRFLSARAPSVIAESSFGRAFPRFYIRGLGNTDFDLNSSQPVSLVYDGVPHENPILKGYPVFDIERVEVLRGPQGTLFGRNSPGGIIKFESRRPGDAFEGYGRAAWGSYNTLDLEGAVGGRVSEALAARVSGLFQSRDDHVDNGFTGEADRYEGFEEAAGRVQLLFTPFDSDFAALLNVHGRSTTGSTRLFRANIIDPGERGIGDGFDRDSVFYDGASQGLELDAWGVTLTVEKSLSESVDLTYIFGRETAETFSRSDGDGGFGAIFLGEGNFGPGPIPFPSQSGGAVDDLVQLTHELRLAYDGGGRLRGQAGLFLFDEDVAITSAAYDTLAPDQPVNGLATRAQETNALGLFASLSYDLSNRLTLSGGARFSDDEKDFVAERQLSPFGAGPLGPLRETVSDDQLSWDVSATYAYSQAINLYSRLAKGYRAPSVQGRLVFGDRISTADSETVLSWEAGMKSQLLEDRLRANANVFYYEISDQQLTIVGGLDNTVALFNADTGEGYGFEADLEALVTANLLLTAGVSYNHTRIKDDVLVAPGCGAPCTILDPPVFDADGNLIGYNISGNAFPYAPEWIASITARYAIAAPGGEFYAVTDWAYKGATNFFLYESAEYGEDGYWEGGLRLGYAANAGYDVSVFARNITDEARLTGAIDFNNLAGYVNEPLTAGVELAYDF